MNSCFIVVHHRILSTSQCADQILIILQKSEASARNLNSYWFLTDRCTLMPEISKTTKLFESCACILVPWQLITGLGTFEQV